MNLVEFSEDNVAFDPAKVTAIYQTEQRHTKVLCQRTCPEREDRVTSYGVYNRCGNTKHWVFQHHTTIVVDGVSLNISRPFHEVMLVLTAHQLDNADKSE